MEHPRRRLAGVSHPARSVIITEEGIAMADRKSVQVLRAPDEFEDEQWRRKVDLAKQVKKEAERAWQGRRLTFSAERNYRT